VDEVVDRSSKPAPLISVVIPAFSRPAQLRSLLSELFDQQAPPGGFEVIVVDDGSPEPIEPAIGDLLATAPIETRVLRRPNGGPSTARNHGASAARGEYLLFIDDDLSIPVDLVSTHLEIHRECGPALVNCELDWRIEAEPEPFARWYRNRTADWSQARAETGKEIGSGVYEISAPMASTANLSLPRAEFERLNGFDPAYPYGCEDQDFSGRADRAGLRILHSDRTRVVHVESHDTLRKLCRRQRLGTRDTVRFLKRFAVEHHVGVPEVARQNDPVNLGADGPALAGKKIIRRMIALPFVAPVGFAAIGVLAKIAPNSRLLPRAYDVMVGAFVQKGWREGLVLHAEVEPLDEWKPTATDKPIASTK
jgi:glycosyltransferase involved in cell wall biosynthesis